MTSAHEATTSPRTEAGQRRAEDSPRIGTPRDADALLRMPAELGTNSQAPIVEPIQIDQQLWTSNDIARYTQLNPGTIRNMQSRRQLPEPIRIGRSVRWIPADVIAHFTSKKAAA